MGVTGLFVSLLASSLALVSGLALDPTIQKPLAAAVGVDSSLHKGHQPWDAPPSSEQVDSLIFFRLATLLQHWPNTRYPSGHSVAPGIIPIGTTLYHGRNIASVPTRPDWLAFDPEHSMVFLFAKESRLFTFVTTRPLRVLYFDGSSAAKMSSGSMDTQDLLAWGRTSNNTMLDELQRIVDLCEWGKDYGIDGYVRMEMSFEIMYCDFGQGIELVSSLHMVPTEGGGMGPSHPPNKHPNPSPGPGNPPDPNDPNSPPPPPPFRETTSQYIASSPSPSPTEHPHRPPRFPDEGESRPPNWKGELPSREQRGFEVFQAGVWHNRAPGEVRVKIDAAKLVSLYDPALRSGIGNRKGKEKVLHRGEGLSDEDVSTWRGWIEDILRKDAPATSGVDWPALATVIMDRYGARLEYLQSLLHPDLVSHNATAVVQNVRSQLMLMLVTDITVDYVPTSTASTRAAQPSQIRRRETQNHTWVEPIAAHCSSFLVSHLPKERMTREERTLYAAVSGTQAEICRVLSLLWAEAYDSPPPAKLEDMANDWRERVDTLMEWLDWPMWNRCKPECSLDTMCFIPTWPIGVGKPPMSNEKDDLSKIDWTPRCIPRGKNMFDQQTSDQRIRNMGVFGPQW